MSFRLEPLAAEPGEQTFWRTSLQLKDSCFALDAISFAVCAFEGGGGMSVSKDSGTNEEDANY